MSKIWGPGHYNVPPRVVLNLTEEILSKLLGIEQIIGLKEASGNVEQMAGIVNRFGNRLVLLSGDDSLTLPVMSIGGRGVISVLANIMPREMADLVRYCELGCYDEARRLHNRLWKLMKALFIETNPGPIKAAMAIMGLIKPGVRGPLCALEPANHARLTAVLQEMGLIPTR